METLSKNDVEDLLHMFVDVPNEPEWGIDERIFEYKRQAPLQLQPQNYTAAPPARAPFRDPYAPYSPHTGHLSPSHAFNINQDVSHLFDSYSHYSRPLDSSFTIYDQQELQQERTRYNPDLYKNITGTPLKNRLPVDLQADRVKLLVFIGKRLRYKMIRKGIIPKDCTDEEIVGCGVVNGKLKIGKPSGRSAAKARGDHCGADRRGKSHREKWDPAGCLGGEPLKECARKSEAPRRLLPKLNIFMEKEEWPAPADQQSVHRR